MFKYTITALLLILPLTPTVASTHHPQEFLKEVANTPHEGEQIVQHYCSNCHAIKPIIRLGAPRIGQSEDWNPRISQGIANLFKHTDEGYNAMPARGGCFECSDEQLMLAILALLPKKARLSLENDLKVHNKYR